MNLYRGSLLHLYHARTLPSISAGEDFVAFSNTYNVNAGVPLPPVFFKVSTILDDITEYAEGFFIYFDIQEFNLDPRDVNQVSLDRDAYLIRIIDPSIFNRLGKQVVTEPWPSCDHCGEPYIYIQGWAPVR